MLALLFVAIVASQSVKQTEPIDVFLITHTHDDVGRAVFILPYQ